MSVHKFPLRAALMGVSLITLSACDGDMDFDLRRFGEGFSTTAAAREAKTAARPQADARGVISYPTYQVAVAQKGDSVSSLAARIGLAAGDVARFNGLKADAVLRAGEILALPKRVAAENAAPIAAASAVDVTTLAGNALDQIGPSPVAAAPQGDAPTRHQVQRGETAYSIARLYGVSARALAEWNSLDSALSVREGQYLLIPVVIEPAPVQDIAAVTQPGEGSSVPLPPSASTALPDEKTTPIATAEAAPSPTPANLGAERTTASSSKMTMPVGGKIVSAFVKGKTDGVDFAASSGATVKAAAAGTVAAITKDTEGVPILVLKHAGNLLTVYAGIDNISVAKGASVSRGQSIASVRSGSNALHFQVREGTTSVDPLTYLN
ncbi:MAG: peptidoglycan DD-metalloendopeptidase family protein [Maritimibacter sp.]